MHGMLFTHCIVWDDKDKVIDFKRLHWIHVGRWSTGRPKLQLFQLSQHSYVTKGRIVSSSAYFPWNMTLKYKMKLSEGSWDKSLHSKLRTRCFGRPFFWRFVSRSDGPKFREQFSRLLYKDYQGKLTTLLEPLHGPSEGQTWADWASDRCVRQTEPLTTGVPKAFLIGATSREP